VHPVEQGDISLELHPALFGDGIAPPIEQLLLFEKASPTQKPWGYDKNEREGDVVIGGEKSNQSNKAAGG
jgi:hypothetical protein